MLVNAGYNDLNHQNVKSKCSVKEKRFTVPT